MEQLDRDDVSSKLDTTLVSDHFLGGSSRLLLPLDQGPDYPKSAREGGPSHWYLPSQNRYLILYAAFFALQRLLRNALHCKEFSSCLLFG